MEIPVHNITAGEIAAAATQTVGAGFTIQHNNKAVVLITIGGSASLRTSDATTAVADGVVDGQILLLIVKDVGDTNAIIIKDNANTVLRGDWYRSAVETWLKLSWDRTASQWIETGRDGGGTTTASGDCSHATGNATTASGDYSHAEGSSTTASGAFSHAEGGSTTASGNISHAQGFYSLASQIGQHAQAYGRFTSTGDAQFSRFVCRRALTPAAAAAVIGLAGTAIGPVIAADTVWTFKAQIAGTAVDAGAVSSAEIIGCLKRAGATVTMPSVQATNVIHADDADIIFTAVADDTNKSLNITVTDATNGAVAYRFVATIQITQITFT